ncbi:MAG TPA: MBOAT family O-acyltransferase [Steroidobacteraceae bacterium]|nr:MBOAT family O-acyltransferase [Steroidobacteraceae bacterium]
MLFNSPLYLIFFLSVFSLYWLVRRRVAQNALLLVAGYVFYGTWSWKFLLLLAFSTLLDYTCGLLIGAAQTQARRRAVLITSAVINLGLLAVFKYMGFFVQQAADLLRLLGFQPHLPLLQVVLPVGISFYTFQSLSYVIDTYRGKVAPERNLLDYAVYVAFFPQLVAGPIERATHLLPQIKRARVWSGAAVETGLQLMVWGLFKKVVIADNLAPYVDAVYSHPAAYSAATLFTATVFFAFQIYCDFSGYSDTARGTARTLGIDLMVNFDLPYFSRSPVEFWQRWHISLSRWFQDYLYYPLALHYVRKGGWGSKYRAHLISMALIGLWHGASWTFLVFGLYWGCVIAAYLYLSERYSELPPSSALVTFTSGAVTKRLHPLLSTTAMFAVACIGWILFRARTLGDFWTVLAGMFAPTGHETVRRLNVLDVRWLWALVLAFWVAEFVYRNQARVFELATGGAGRRLVLRYAMVCTIVVSYVAAQHGRALPFIYFQF